MPLLWHGVIPSQLQDFASAFVELSYIPVHPVFHPVYVLNSSLALQCSNWPQSGVVTTVVLLLQTQKTQI